MLRRFSTIVIIAIIAATTACGGGDDPIANGAERVATVEPLPVPTGDVVLTARGVIGQPNVGDEAQADLAGIESLGTVTQTVYEPFVSAEIEFTGVPLDTVLAAIGVDDDIPLTWTALDEYEVHYSRGEVVPEGPLLATRQDGQPIPIADGGPIRVVFADDSGLIGRDTDHWIWSLALVEAG